MEKINNLILVLASAIEKGSWVWIYNHLWKENRYSIYPYIWKENVYTCSNQEELKDFNIINKDILQKILNFVNDWYKKD